MMIPKKIKVGRPISFVAAHKNIVASVCEQSVLVWDIITGEQVQEFQSHQHLSSLAFSKTDMRVLSGGGSISLWHCPMATEQKRFDGHDGKVTGVAFAGDYRTIVSGSADGTLRVWNTHTGLEVKRIEVGAPVRHISMAPTGKHVVAVAEDRYLFVFDTQTGQMTLGEYPFQAAGISHVAVGSQPAFVIGAGNMGGSKTVVESDLNDDGNEQLLDHSTNVDGRIYLWRVQGRGFASTEPMTIHDHDTEIWEVACPSSGRIVGSSGSDGKVKLWNVATGQIVAVLDGDDHPMSCLAFTRVHDGHRVVAGDRGGTIFGWDVTDILAESV